MNWRGFFAAPDLPAEKKAQFVKALQEMYSTAEWGTVRDRNGWVEIFNPDDKFVEFLEGQEKEVADLMKELGFM